MLLPTSCKWRVILYVLTMNWIVCYDLREKELFYVVVLVPRVSNQTHLESSALGNIMRTHGVEFGSHVNGRGTDHTPSPSSLFKRQLDWKIQQTSAHQLDILRTLAPHLNSVRTLLRRFSTEITRRNQKAILSRKTCHQPPSLAHKLEPILPSKPNETRLSSSTEVCEKGYIISKQRTLPASSVLPPAQFTPRITSLERHLHLSLCCERHTRFWEALDILTFGWLGSAGIKRGRCWHCRSTLLERRNGWMVVGNTTRKSLVSLGVA